MLHPPPRPPMVELVGDVLPRHYDGSPPDGRETSPRPFPVYYDFNTRLTKDGDHCMEMLRSVYLFPFGRRGYMKGSHGPQQLPAMDHAQYGKMRLTKVDPRLRDPSDTYTFAAVDDKTKQQLHRANTRTTTYNNLHDAGEAFMQRLDEATRAEREVENNAVVARVCQQIDIPMRSASTIEGGGDTSTSSSGR